MKYFSFNLRSGGTNIYASHINDLQNAIQELSYELENGIGTYAANKPAAYSAYTAGGMKKITFGAATSSLASLNVPTASATPSTPASGDIWNDAGTLKFYNGSATKTLAFTDTAGSGNVTGAASSVDGEVVLFSGTTGSALKRATVTGLAKLTSGVLSAAAAGTDYAAASHTHAISDVTGLQTALDLKAALASPTFTGTPAAPTAAVDTNTTQVATTAYVVGQGYLKSATASSTYAALSHSHAIGDVTNLQSSLDLKAALASPTFTGTPAAPTATADTNTTQLATTAYVVGQASSTTPVVDGTAAVGTSLKYARADHVHPTDTSRAASSHTHAIADVTNLQTSLDGKAATSHTHAASDVTSGTFNIARIPTGTTSSTVSLGDHLHSGVYEPAFTTLSIAKGGTGQTTATAAINALLPSQTSNSGKYLTTDGTNTSWATVSGGGGATTLDGLSDVTAPSPSTGEYLRWNGSAWVDAYITGAWTVTFGDGTNAIATGYQIPVVYVPYDHVVTAHTILVPSGTTAVTGSLAVAVNRQPIANYPGSTNLSTIFTPTLSTQSIVTTTGLSTAVSAGIYRFNVTTATPTLTKVAIIFEFYRTT